MKIFAVIFIFLWILSELDGSSYTGNDSGTTYKTHRTISNSTTKRNMSSTFEESDSYYDRHGDEHLIDEDGYCKDCDDYHDD